MLSAAEGESEIETTCRLDSLQPATSRNKRTKIVWVIFFMMKSIPRFVRVARFSGTRQSGNRGIIPAEAAIDNGAEMGRKLITTFLERKGLAL